PMRNLLSPKSLSICAPTVRMRSGGKCLISTTWASPVMQVSPPRKLVKKYWLTQQQALSNCSMMWTGLTWRVLIYHHCQDRDHLLCNNIALHMAIDLRFPYMDYRSEPRSCALCQYSEATNSRGVAP